MAMLKYTREDCIFLLQNKQNELHQANLTRFPQRSDFQNEEVVAIKAFLGPWPRALEAAGLKEPRENDHPEANREKRARAKKRRRREKKAVAQKETNIGKTEE